jgi:hypothetical protein
LGISGPYSASETTLAYLLASIFALVQNTFHGDDFCEDISLLLIFNGCPDAHGPQDVKFERVMKTLSF